jgi:hypothetical protein
MTTLTTGYQWGDDNSYIGEYPFEVNGDDEEPHIPPRTTLIPPPGVAPVGSEWAWDGKAWITRAEDLSWMDPDSLARMLAHRASPGLPETPKAVRIIAQPEAAQAQAPVTP